MEIEFNPSRIENSAASQPLVRGTAAVPSQDTAAGAGLDKTSALKAAIGNLSLTRPEKVDAARASVSAAGFPPDEMLNAIASLFADKIQ